MFIKPTEPKMKSSINTDSISSKYRSVGVKPCIVSEKTSSLSWTWIWMNRTRCNKKKKYNQS